MHKVEPSLLKMHARKVKKKKNPRTCGLFEVSVVALLWFFILCTHFTHFSTLYMSVYRAAPTITHTHPWGNLDSSEQEI